MWYNHDIYYRRKKSTLYKLPLILYIHTCIKPKGFKLWGGGESGTHNTGPDIIPYYWMYNFYITVFVPQCTTEDLHYQELLHTHGLTKKVKIKATYVNNKWCQKIKLWDSIQHSCIIRQYSHIINVIWPTINCIRLPSSLNSQNQNALSISYNRHQY